MVIKNLYIMKTLSKVFLVTALFLFAACQKEDITPESGELFANAKASPAAQQGDETIAKIVSDFADDGQFTLLLAALDYAGITSMFAERGQYTVFAPTDTAFRNFLGENDLTDFTPEQVAAVLQYHVTDGRRFSNSVVPKNSPREIETLLGLPFYVMSNGDIDTNDADMDRNASILIGAELYDLPASNGVIHVIDEVLVPITE